MVYPGYYESNENGLVYEVMAVVVDPSDDVEKVLLRSPSTGRSTLFTPEFICGQFMEDDGSMTDRFTYAGTLNHSPNKIRRLLKKMGKKNLKVKVRCDSMGVGYKNGYLMLIAAKTVTINPGEQKMVPIESKAEFSIPVEFAVVDTLANKLMSLHSFDGGGTTTFMKSPAYVWVSNDGEYPTTIDLGTSVISSNVIDADILVIPNG